MAKMDKCKKYSETPTTSALKAALAPLKNR